MPAEPFYGGLATSKKISAPADMRMSALISVSELLELAVAERSWKTTSEC